MIDEETQKKIDDIGLEIENLNSIFNDLKNRPLEDHFHLGTDVSKVEFNSVGYRKHWLSHTIYGNDVTTAANYGVIFINQMGACHVSNFYEVHQIAGTDAGAVTLMLEKLTGTEAIGAGADVLSTALSLKTTADTVQQGTLTTTLANRNLALGDRLALEDTGALTDLVNITIFVELTFTI